MRIARPVVLVVLALLTAAPALARPRTLTVRIPAFDVPPRSNREICTFITLPQRKGMDVAEVTITNQGAQPGFGSHHLIVYAYKGNLNLLTADEGKVVDDTACLNLGPGDPTALQILATSQLPDSRQRMPRGTALRVDALPYGRSRVVGLVLNSHWINGTDSTQRARAVVKLVPAHGKIKRRLQPIFEAVASGFIDVPPGETKTVGWSWGPGFANLGSFLGGTANPSGDACVTMLTGHMHRRGTLFTADLMDDAAHAQRRLYTNTVYGEPPLLNLTPPLLVRRGQRIAYECVHDNATDPKLGCEEEPGVAPGRPVASTFPAFNLHLAAKGCGTEGPNPTECPATDAKYPGRTFTGNCVKARLVFGFTSEDDMCILPGYYFDPMPDGSCNLK